jgi:hypothetical protein
LKRFGATRIGVASRWADALNTKLVAYLKHAGIEVQAITNANQWAGKAFSMSLDEGVRLSFQLGKEARKRAPEAQAILLAGGAWRSLAAVPVLEEDFGGAGGDQSDRGDLAASSTRVTRRSAGVGKIVGEQRLAVIARSAATKQPRVTRKTRFTCATGSPRSGSAACSR